MKHAALYVLLLGLTSCSGWDRQRQVAPAPTSEPRMLSQRSTSTGTGTGMGGATGTRTATTTATTTAAGGSAGRAAMALVLLPEGIRTLQGAGGVGGVAGLGGTLNQ